MDKNTLGILAIIFVVVLAVSGTFGEFDIGNITSGLSFWDKGTGLVDVSKQIKGYLGDKYAGGAIDTGDNVLNLYKSDGKTIAESNLETDANGHFTTGTDYKSGGIMYLRYEESNTKQWFQFTVPQMNSEDAQSATYNIVEYESFVIGTWGTSDSMKYANGTAITDAWTHDVSDGDGTSPTMTYTVTNIGNDNTGMMSSYDPLYGQNWDIELYLTLTGTGYEKVIVYGFDYDFTLGTTHYVGKTLNAYDQVLHKQGLTYLSLGTKDTTFWLDLSGLSGSDSVVMQLYVYAYADHNYAQQHGGSFGPEAYQLSEHTVTLAY